MKEQEGQLTEDSLSIFCQLARELKKDIPKACNDNLSYLKASGKNEKHGAQTKLSHPMLTQFAQKAVS